MLLYRMGCQGTRGDASLHDAPGDSSQCLGPQGSLTYRVTAPHSLVAESRPASCRFVFWEALIASDREHREPGDYAASGISLPAMPVKPAMAGLLRV